MRIPTIHLNGTSGETLRSEYFAAATAVGKAIDALSMVTVHGRDYYVQNTATSADASCEAMNEHRERINTLKKVRAELHAILDDIDDQLRARNASRK